MTIGKKLLGGVGLLTAAFAVYVGFTAYEMNRIAQTQQLATEVAVSLKYAGQLDTLVASMTADQRNLLIESLLGEAAAVDRVAHEFDAHARAFEAALAELQRNISTAEERRIATDLANRIPVWRQTFAQLQQLCAAQQIASAEAFRSEKADALAAEMDSLANSFIALQDQDIETTRQRNAQIIARTKMTAAISVCLTAVVAIAIILFTRKVVRSIQGITAELGCASEQLSGAAAELAASSQALAQGASEQSASVEETSASTEEINAITRENTASAAQAADLMGGAAEQISVANRKLGQLIESMKEIGASSDKISKIIKIIDEIAFQTNLLALNAAVEAARAGEAGMGFAVVADEVRNLAQRCAQAASDTTGLIQESINNAQNGGRRLNDVANAVSAITASADQVKVLIDKVNSGSMEQTRGIDHVARAVTQIESVTQRAAANAEQAASASEELAGQATALRGIVGRLGELAGAARA